MTRGEMMSTILDNARGLVLLLEQAEDAGMGPEWERMVGDRLDALADLAPSHERVRGEAAAPVGPSSQSASVLDEPRSHTDQFADVLRASTEAANRVREEIADQSKQAEEQRWELLMMTMRAMTLAIGEIKSSLQGRGIGG